jgi:hypothetical protein
MKDEGKGMNMDLLLNDPSPGSSLSPHPSSVPVPLPAAGGAMRIRPAVMGDLGFVDRLQKIHTKMVGWMPTRQLESKIERGHVLVAEEKPKDEGGRMKDEAKVRSASVSAVSSFIPHPSPFLPIGYIIGHDQYFKRDDCGIIYQVNVLPGKQRSLVGAMLVRALFERAAYGCRLFCCWCAQDLAANRFWESLGFVPLAFRAGSRGRGRVHIFWQRRIRADDTTTPWWFPSQTSSGSIREDRIVLPIPPGVHWSDEMPRILPGREESGPLPVVRGQKQEMKDQAKARALAGARRCGDRSASTTGRRQLTIDHAGNPPAARPRIAAGGLRFGTAAAAASPGETSLAKVASTDGRLRTTDHARKRPMATEPSRKRETKNDPKLIAAARELRDRWLEQMNAGEDALQPRGKYQIGRANPAALEKRSARARRALRRAA